MQLIKQPEAASYGGRVLISEKDFNQIQLDAAKRALELAEKKITERQLHASPIVKGAPVKEANGWDWNTCINIRNDVLALAKGPNLLRKLINK